MYIRKATLEDLDQLTFLFDRYRIFYEKESDMESARLFLQERITNKESEIFVAVVNDNLLTGFVQLYPLFSSTRMKRLWLLNDLFVDSDYRGNGISLKLLEKAKELARETASAGLILETSKTNIIGNRLYPKTGFTLDTVTNYYSWETE